MTTQPLICVIPYCQSDHQAAKRLLEWIKELDPHQYHHLLLVADDSVPIEIKRELDALGKSIFASCESITPKVPAAISHNYHPAAAMMFHQAMSHIKSCYRWPWLWCEPDCVPLKSGWLDALAEGYATCPKRYMGALATFKQEGVPPTVMFATAVYPPLAFDDLKLFCDGKQAFDMAFSGFVVPRAQNTTLIQHVFGAPNDPPRFKDLKDTADGPNVGTLASIKDDAVLFHRNKDGSLIELLRKQTGCTEMTTCPPVEPNPYFDQSSPPIPLPPDPPMKRKPGRPRVVHTEHALTQSVT